MLHLNGLQLSGWDCSNVLTTMQAVYNDNLFSDETLEIAEEITLSDLLLLGNTCADSIIRAMCSIRKHTITDLATDVPDDSLEVVRDINKFTRSLGQERRQLAFERGKIHSDSDSLERKPVIELREKAPQLTLDVATKLGTGVITALHTDKQQSFTAAEFNERFKNLWLQGGQRDFNAADEEMHSSNVPVWKSLASQARVRLRNQEVITFRKLKNDYFITTSFA